MTDQNIKDIVSSVLEIFTILYVTGQFIQGLQESGKIQGNQKI